MQGKTAVVFGVPTSAASRGPLRSGCTAQAQSDHHYQNERLEQEPKG